MLLKRGFDVVVSAVALLLLLPLIVIGGSATFLCMGPPVFFRQARPGLHGRPFQLFKLRTMRMSSPEAPLDDEERLTVIGRLLRRTSVDEIPQLLNVLRGDMSLVGPRPLLMEYLPLYTARQRRRHEVRPGITGWAQVNGRNALTWPEKFELDVWYVDNRSFLLDVRILLRTARAVLSRRGISHDGDATMPRFTGAFQ